MGLIKRAMDSIKGTLEDQFETVITCEDLGNQLLMVKKTKHNGIIRNGSRIVVNPGQLAVLVDNGRVIDAAAEPGVFEFQSEASPSFFGGNFGGVFKEMWTRFVFGGATWQDQAVYFVNTKEIIDNGFGTPAPVMYRDWEHQAQNSRMPGQFLPLRVAIKCRGNYTFEINEPALFMQKIGGTAPIYQKDELCGQMRQEIIAVFQAVLNSLCNEQSKVFPMDLPAQSFLIKQMMDQQMFDQQIRARGIRIVGFNVVNVDLDDESKKKVDEFLREGDTHTQQARMVSAAQLAAANEAGAGVGFFNVGLMNQATNHGMFQGPASPMPQSSQGWGQQPYGQPSYGQPTQYGASSNGTPQYGQPSPYTSTPTGMPSQPVQQASTGTTCVKCGAALSGPFCAQCGTPAPAPTERFCSQCGAKVTGPFCANCGMKQ
jgi:membrane protease subunit (stomatin/prohibitin family)